MALDQWQSDQPNLLRKFWKSKKDTENLAKTRKEMASNEAAAYRLLRLALSLADKGKERPSIKDVNEVRYFLSFLNFQRGNYYDAAVIERVTSADSAPNPPRSRQGAR